MATTESPQAAHEQAPATEDYFPTWYIGHHDSKRIQPVSNILLDQAHAVGYDTVTSPITNDHFHSRVLSLLSSHLSGISVDDSSTADSSTAPPAPIITPLTPADTPLTPGDVVSQLVAFSSNWIDLCSPNPVIASISRQVLSLEFAYAAFCGIGTVVVAGPRHNGNNRSDGDGVTRYARAIQEALNTNAYIQVAVQFSMFDEENGQAQSDIGDLSRFGPGSSPLENSTEGKDLDLFGAWDTWNVVRSVCKYNSRLSVALSIPRQLPPESLQSRWYAEPLRMLLFSSSAFLRNKGGHPVLSRNHQVLISRYMRLKHTPWILLADVDPVPELDLTQDLGYVSPGTFSDNDGTGVKSPTPAEASKLGTKAVQKPHTRIKDITAHLIYLRHLQKTQPPKTAIERFGSGYQDFLQAPLQPLSDNLESITYEVFEKDPIKYDWYEAAITKALEDWQKENKPTSSPNGAVVIAVAGSGRGPLVTRALRASMTTGVHVQVWAVEKNPNAYVLLQRRNIESWGGVVTVVKSDMRAWKGPLLSPSTATTPPQYGKVDILVSELLGSFADNELSPECLDGVQHVLAPDGISVPSSYTAHLSPILAPRLHADIFFRGVSDPTAADTPYVVMLHAIDFLAVSVPGHPRIQQAWEFVHPLPPATLATAEARRSGGVSGGGGGSMVGGDGANEHNSRFARLKFVCKDRGVINGLAGYFEAVLYAGQSGLVELSTRPDTIDAKSKDMISWFPIFFPLKNPLYFPDDSELEVSIWRQTDDRKVWYEWLVEAYIMVGPTQRIRIGISDMGTSRKVGCLM